LFELLKDDVLSSWSQDGFGRSTPDGLPTWRGSEVLFAASALIYPAWHWILTAVMPTAQDSLNERMLVGAVMIGVILCCRARALRRHIEVAEQGLLFLMTTHYFSLVWRNDLATPYIVGTFVLFGYISVTFTRLLVTVIYAAYCLAMGLVMVALLGHSMPLQLEWLLGMASVLVAITIGTYRSAALRRVAMTRIAHDRRLLKQIIETIPDPIFVRDVDRALVLSNEAGRQFENATGYDLGAVVRHEDQVLADRHTLEADVEVKTYSGPLAVSIKTAVAEVRKDNVMLVTVMRDVTTRRALEESLRNKVLLLEESRERVRQLQGMLPICMHCSRIRTDGKEWETLETYVTKNSRTSFTHTLCSTCLAAHYPADGDA
jgi:PAS domain-containing protein